MRRNDEAKLQSECFRWFRYAYPKHRKLFFAIPNGGSRNIIEASNLKAQGVVAGVADTFLLISGRGLYGLFIEFKVGKNNLTYEQSEFMCQVKKNNYGFEVVRNIDDFMNIIKNYLNERD